MTSSLRLLSYLIFVDKSSIRFVLGIILGLAFSITTILGTIGIMDAFDFTLRSALRDSGGDISIRSRYGFFSMKGEIQTTFDNMKITKYSSIIKSQGFAINGEISKGVLVYGIDENSFSQVSGLVMNFSKGDIVLGTELAKRLAIKAGDYVVLGIANGNTEMAGLPQLKRFKVAHLIKHAIFQKDTRMLYVKRNILAEMMRIKEHRYNGLILSLPLLKNKKITSENDQQIKDTAKDLAQVLGYDYIVRPYWKEFSTFLKAIKTEKFMIGMILQLIVIISVINVLAFIIFLNEKRSKEIFLFKAMGMSQGAFVKIWLSMVVILWGVSCSVSLGMVHLLKIFLNNFSYFEKLSEIYNLGSLSLLLTWSDYVLVFSVALGWVIGIAWWGLRRMKRKSLLDGLRKEFA